MIYIELIFTIRLWILNDHFIKPPKISDLYITLKKIFLGKLNKILKFGSYYNHRKKRGF
jgi:hypothetical protein